VSMWRHNAVTKGQRGQIIRHTRGVMLTVAVLGTALLGAMPAQKVLAFQGSAPGDSPDLQVFVIFRSHTGGYELQVPQGWARTTRGPDVRFTSALDGVEVTVTSAPAAPTVASARTKEVVALEKSGRSVHLTKVQDTQLPAGAAVLVEYTSASTPDPVTGKSLRVQNATYLFFRHGKLATLTLWAPLGADNIDQWGRMARSFKWV
jgi:hypothetical protein